METSTHLRRSSCPSVSSCIRFYHDGGTDRARSQQGRPFVHESRTISLRPPSPRARFFARGSEVPPSPRKEESRERKGRLLQTVAERPKKEKKTSYERTLSLKTALTKHIIFSTLNRTSKASAQYSLSRRRHLHTCGCIHTCSALMVAALWPPTASFPMATIHSSLSPSP